MSGNAPKYAAPGSIDLPGRMWPSRSITKAPQWCSVDLRDGNQALPNPLDPDQKHEYFQMLCDIGFKQIEVAFPSASRDDFEFVRRLVTSDRTPRDVYIMVLTTCRDKEVVPTLESVHGARKAIVHAYIASSDLHAQQVFNMSRKDVIATAVSATQRVSQAVASEKGDVRYEFSPEEFTDADLPFVLELCEAVYETWGRATPEKPLIFNLPATVERRPPNHYADMIEWFCGKFSHRENICVSLHAHNDQGMAVAATELALLAGADRVEGALFGHGERTGNVDIVTVAMNLHSRGIDTGLDFSRLPEISRRVEKLTGMPIPPRQPYAGELVFTAFSGTHQDAIRKGLNRLNEAPGKFGVRWKVPYLHIDPTDVGCQYQGLIRINAQSGKGGVAWVLERDFSLQPPKEMHPEIGAAVKDYSDSMGREITIGEVHKVFQDEFVAPAGPYELVGYWPRPDDANPTQVHGEIRLKLDGKEQTVLADGNGPVSAFVAGMRKLGAESFAIDDYHEQAAGKGAEARAVAYVPLRFDDGTIMFGVGIDTNIDQAAVRAIVAGLNRRSLRKSGKKQR